ncbi:MAG: DUF2007 domain-containing protein [Chloroflexia bacterium]|nr:DUF2007 domain-containing protein [Chloroflexia bacterium]
MTSPRDDPVVYLATAPNEPLAQLWAEILEDAGIKVMMKPIGPGFGAWGSNATFEHELYVLRSRLREAEAVIAEIEPDRGPDSFL